jgi:hypothetical protein
MDPDNNKTNPGDVSGGNQPGDSAPSVTSGVGKAPGPIAPEPKVPETPAPAGQPSIAGSQPAPAGGQQPGQPVKPSPAAGQSAPGGAGQPGPAVPSSESMPVGGDKSGQSEPGDSQNQEPQV